MSLSEKLEAARVALGKRKERELQAQGQGGLGGAPGPGPASAKAAGAEPKAKPAPSKAAAEPQVKSAQGANNNKLLAGHLAHEYLTRGTLLGRCIEPSRAALAPAPAADDDKRRYNEVSCLLMSGGAHIPDVVNPTQLARWLQIKE